MSMPPHIVLQLAPYVSMPQYNKCIIALNL